MNKLTNKIKAGIIRIYAEMDDIVDELKLGPRDSNYKDQLIRRLNVLKCRLNVLGE